MPQLHETGMGQTFFGGTLPRIAAALEKLAGAAEKFVTELPIPQFNRGDLVLLREVIEYFLADGPVEPDSLRPYHELLERVRKMLGGR